MWRCTEGNMKNEQEKSNNRLYIGIIIVALAFCAAYFLRSCGNVGIEQLHKSTDQTVGAVEKQHETIGCELDTVGAELDSAGTAVGRADELIATGEERVAENAASIADCKRIVSECRKIVADCQRIVSEVEEANRSRAGSGSR